MPYNKKKTLSFVVYQVGTWITTGAVGAGFVPGLMAVFAIVAVIVGLIKRTEASFAVEYKLS